MKSIRISFKALELTLFSYLFTTHHPFLYFRWAVFVIKCARVLSCFSRVQLFATQWIAANLLCPWDSPGKNTGMDCHALLQGIFPTQESNLCPPNLLHWRVGSLKPQVEDWKLLSLWGVNPTDTRIEPHWKSLFPPLPMKKWTVKKQVPGFSEHP